MVGWGEECRPDAQGSVAEPRAPYAQWKKPGAKVAHCSRYVTRLEQVNLERLKEDGWLVGT